jgi:hypothetical protein
MGLRVVKLVFFSRDDKIAFALPCSAILEGGAETKPARPFGLFVVSSLRRSSKLGENFEKLHSLLFSFV